MLSLPLLPPPVTLSTHHHGPFRPLPEDPSANSAQNQPHNPQHRAHQQRRDEERKAHNLNSPLNLLAADEAAIAHRKAAIRHLGAYWIRPPGVTKTLQAMSEEEAERLELEEIQRQERGLADLQAQQQVEEARQRAAEAAAQPDGAGEVEGEEEVDLDAEIPDADEEVDEEDEEESEEDMTGDVTGDFSFNEASVVEGSFVDPSWTGQQDRRFTHQQGEDGEWRDVEQLHSLEEAELTGAARDEEALGVERDLDLDVPDMDAEGGEEEYEHDLDDSIPEAGSYQHTDTELEDSDSEALDSSLLPAAPPPQNLAVDTPSFAAQSSTRRSTRSTRLRPAPVLAPPLTSSSPGFASADIERHRAPAIRGGAAGQGPSRRGGLQERMRAHLSGGTAEEPLPRSPGTWNLSSSLIESSFVGSSPVMARNNTRGRGGRGGARGGRGGE